MLRRMCMASEQRTAAGKDDRKSEAGLQMLSRIRATWHSFHRLRRGIGLRLLARVLLFSAAITLILTLFQLYVEYRYDVRAIERRMSEIEGSYLQSLGDSLWNLDSRQLELQIEGILRLPAVRFGGARDNRSRQSDGGERRSPPGPRRCAPRILAVPYGSRRAAAAWRAVDRSHVRRGLSRAPREGDRHLDQPGRDDLPRLLFHPLYHPPARHEASDRTGRISRQIRSAPAAAAPAPAAARDQGPGRA